MAIASGLRRRRPITGAGAPQRVPGRVGRCLAAAGLAAGLGIGMPAAAQSVPDFAPDVKRVAENDLQSWINDPVIIYALREQNERHEGIRKGKIAFLDETWIAENGRGPMIFDLLDRQASVIVRDRRELSNGIITEIIVMDSQGLNVAISDPTSDYYQGDEAKYQETFLKGPGAVHVGEIEFDDSTQKYQTQVSMTVTDPESGVPIGAVTFGIDLEALRAQAPTQ